jgi:hypothetical protein
MIVDNRESQRRIQNINCYLRQTVRILKDKNDEAKGSFWSQNYDLHRIQINKGNFADINNKSLGSNEDSKRVYGKFMLEFNLKKILANIQKLASMDSVVERNKLIRLRSSDRTGMKGVNYTSVNIEGSSYFINEVKPMDPSDLENNKSLPF